MTRLALLVALLAQDPGARLPLADGRVLHGKSVRKSGKNMILETVFGRLDVPRALMASGKVRKKTPEPKTRIKKTRWLEIESDLSPARAQLYADSLDTFFDWMVRVYDLDAKRLTPPYRMRVFRRRADFKALQKEIAPGIDEKGQAFAEGVAGFYSPAHGRIFLWDVEGGHDGVFLEVAKHETTHLLNSLLSRQSAIRIPTWFEEGAATYFSMSMALPGKKVDEPPDHPGALAQVVGEIEGEKPYKGRDLRSVGWAKFLGREYSWSWGMVRFLRQHKGGKLWKELLKHLRTISGGAVTDSEERRFLKMAGFRDSAAFDKAWHAHLAQAKPAGRNTPIGTSPAVLARVARIKKPPKDLARHFSRIGMSLARARESEPAIVYLRAALRGGIADARVYYVLAIALAERDDLARDEQWPNESFRALQDAVKRAPLATIYRLELGRQHLLRNEAQAAHDMLGLALVLVGANDDDVEVAMWLLRAATALGEDSAEKLAERLAGFVPPATAALRAALVYHLQAVEEWEQLTSLLARRLKAKTATLEERAMLARLYKLMDRLDEAETILAACLKESPCALHLWPDLVECLAGQGKSGEAVAARVRALNALRDDKRSLGWIRRRLERIQID